MDNVEDYVTSRAEVESTLVRFQEMISWVCSCGFSVFLGGDVEAKQFVVMQKIPIHGA